MSEQQPSTLKSQRMPRQLGSAWVLVACGLMLSVGYWWYHDGHRGGLIEIDRADPLEAKFQVDVNRADWPELIQLPGLGKVLAKRVLVDRREHGPFQDVDDLVRVDGIGVKTLEKIRPYLLPIPKDTDWAEIEFDQGQRLQ